MLQICTDETNCICHIRTIVCVTYKKSINWIASRNHYNCHSKTSFAPFLSPATPAPSWWRRWRVTFTTSARTSSASFSAATTTRSSILGSWHLAKRSCEPPSLKRPTLLASQVRVREFIAHRYRVDCFSAFLWKHFKVKLGGKELTFGCDNLANLVFFLLALIPCTLVIKSIKK